MANIIDYLKWRGDLSFSADPFNEVDALVLCQFEYIRLDDIVSAKLTDKITIADVNRLYSTVDLDKSKQIISYEQDKELLRLMAESKRFGNMQVSGYRNKVDKEADLQFSAVTCFPDDGSIFVVFRGTDSTLVGWKEDFMLSYVNQTSSQEEALDYLSKNFMGVNCPIRIGGHSKGGNLSVFAAMKCPEEIRRKIVSIYSYDAPGFRDEIINSQEYQCVLPLVRSFIPEGSVIGRLLGSELEHKLVKNSVSGLMQHLAYNWELERNHFIFTNKPTRSGELMNKTITGWLDNFSDNEREEFVSTIFDVLDESDAASVNDLKGVKNYTAIIKAIGKLPPEKQKVLRGALKKIAISGKGALLSRDEEKTEEKKANFDGSWEAAPLADWGEK